MALQNRIRRLRFDQDEMTQQDLADAVGVTRQTINAIELGKYSPSLEIAFRIAGAFGVALEQVFQYEADAPPHRRPQRPVETRAPLASRRTR